MTFWELVAAVALGVALGYGMAVGMFGIIAALSRLAVKLARRALGVVSPSTGALRSAHRCGAKCVGVCRKWWTS